MAGRIQPRFRTMSAPHPFTPHVIQGGMGVGISGWRLARAVSSAGQLGIVAGTGLDLMLTRRLEDGDPGGHLRRALAALPLPGVAQRIVARYFRPEGRPAGTPYRLAPMMAPRMSVEREELLIAGSFAEVRLAREGHDAAVGINLLTKIQLPTLATLYGAMLAGVGYVLMGAGIPREIPGALDRLAVHEPADLRLDVAGAHADETFETHFDPRRHLTESLPALTRPRFFAIVSSHALATLLARKATGSVDGFIVEGPTAGGHNAPPRGDAPLNARGEPIYGTRDTVDLATLRALGLPFWIAGGQGSPEALVAAREQGAAGIQVGTLFAFCEESGLLPELREAALAAARAGRLDVFTDPRASPTGFPFKILSFDGKPLAPDARERLCDLGVLRSAYRRDDGSVGYRCPGEPVATYVAKGGELADTEGRRCLCNVLTANIGLAQVRPDGSIEQPLLTAGDQARRLGEFLNGRKDYCAQDVLDYLRVGIAATPELCAGASRTVTPVENGT